MFIKGILLLYVLGFVEAEFSYYRPSTSSCPIPRINNGRARPRQRGLFLMFSCSSRYTLVGNRYATCRFGHWDLPIPVCVRTGCPQLEEVKNAVNMTSHNDAWLVFFCLPGHELVGSPVIYCDGSQWNSTAPECENSEKRSETECDFEQPNICGWKPDAYHNFDWIRLNKKTPSSFLQTGPSYDHTYGKNGSGYYMYIESTGKIENETARLLSPVYKAELAKDGCFVFWYHMFGRSIGGLVVYQKPGKLSMYQLQELHLQSRTQNYTLFEQWGDQGNEWYSAVAMLSDVGDNFQIVIEGIRGASFTSDIAIDDVSVQHGENCTAAMSQATTPPTVFPSTSEGYSNTNSSVLPPQTQKLIATSTETLPPTNASTTRSPKTSTTTTTTKRPPPPVVPKTTSTTTTKKPATTTTTKKTTPNTETTVLKPIFTRKSTTSTIEVKPMSSSTIFIAQTSKREDKVVAKKIGATVTSSPLTQSKTWPWQVGKEYQYDVNTYTWTSFDNSNSNGNAFKAQFIIRVVAPGQLLAKLSQPLYAQVQVEKITYNVVPSDLMFQPIQITDQPFEIFVEGGRVKSFNVPLTLSVAHENLFKGLISALQVDISAFGHVDSFPNSFDKETFQGLFKKVETDVTGECETLYNVSPLSSEWRREIPKFASEEDPVEIIKGKNYGSWKKLPAFYSGLSEGAIWNGIAYENEEKQFIKHTSESRLVAGKQGTIFKSEVISSVSISPLMFGKQKAEVYSFVKAFLSSVQEISDAEWKKPEGNRQIDSLLYSVSESMLVLKDIDQSIANAQKLLQDLTPLLQTPNKLPEADFLSKFNVLVRVLASLNSEHLTQLTSNINTANSSKNVAKAGMWVIYRDAVAQAGTFAAFEQIKSWILTKKVQGEEAAELITAIGAALRYPTKKVMTEFFDLATNPEVKEQQFLNNSALLAATKFCRFSVENLFVVDNVIPRLSEYLKEAIENGDSNKAQVYVRVLGNLAHPDVLRVFAPYLDGRVAVTKYLRIQIVASLKSLANLKNESVRAVLFSILRNTAEPYEVRVLAALNIFMAFPTAEMMQVMAHMTNDDPSTQVRAVLVNGINFAAGLKDLRFTKLVKTAQSVQAIVSKEKFGYRISTDSIIDTYTSEDDIAFFRELSYVGSEDHFLPVYHRAALRARGTGWTEENQITMSVTGVQQLLDYIVQMVYDPNTSKVDLKFSAKKVAESLNIKREPSAPLEGSVFVDILNQQKLITFNEANLKSFIASTIKNVEQLFKGVDVQYTKVLSQRQAYVVFPLAAGVPFFFDYSEPLLLSVNGQVKVKLDFSSNELVGSLNTNLDITYARNLDGRVGFLDTLGDVYTTVGVVNKIQFHLPTNLNTMVLPGQVKLNFVLPEHDATFIHLSVWPYTTLQKTESLLTVSENPATKYIERSAKVISTDLKLGNLAGVSFLLQGHSYSTDFKNPSDLYNTDILSNIGTLLYQKDIAFTQFNLKYLANQTSNKDVAFNLFFDTLFNQKQSGELGPASVVKDVSANSETRREEIAKRAATGIESAEVQIYDFSAVFNGKHKVEYVFTAAIADSFVDNKTQGVFFINGLEQINAVFKIVNPTIVPLNFAEALKNKIKVIYEADLKYGNSENIHLQGFSERSEKYTEQLSNDPLAKQCLQEISKDNSYQKDCFKMIVKAHAPDYFKFTVTHKDRSPAYLDTFEILKKTYSWEQELDVSKTIDDGKLEIVVQSFYYDNYGNYEFTSKYGVLRLNNVKTLGYYTYAMAVYGPITKWERAYNYYYGYQYLPYCAVDSSKVQTFSGRSYDYSLTSSWHAVMVDESNDFGKWTDLVILARRPSDKQQEIYVSYKTPGGKYVELDIYPTAVQVKSNTNEVSEGALTTYWDDIEYVPLLQYYTLADGVLVVNINNGALRLVYDRQRLVIFTADHRSTTRGICGQSSTQTRDDYLTPYGLVDLPELYGASFSLDSEFSDPKTVELKKEAKLKAYQPVTRYTNILRSDAEWSKSQNYSH